MRKMGVEPTRAKAHRHLKTARLPFRHFRITKAIVNRKYTFVKNNMKIKKCLTKLAKSYKVI